MAGSSGHDEHIVDDPERDVVVACLRDRVEALASGGLLDRDAAHSRALREVRQDVRHLLERAGQGGRVLDLGADSEAASGRDARRHVAA